MDEATRLRLDQFSQRLKEQRKSAAELEGAKAQLRAKDTFHWEPRPEPELTRLTKLLGSHLRAHGVVPSERTPGKSRQLLLKTLEEQNGSCYFSGGDDRFCWNHPKDGHLKYLKLEWGHLVPKDRRTDVALKMVLLCARCNNHIQTSRTLEQLIPELEHKLAVLKSRVRA
jgi:hypothetical protein